MYFKSVFYGGLGLKPNKRQQIVRLCLKQISARVTAKFMDEAMKMFRILPAHCDGVLIFFSWRKKLVVVVVLDFSTKTQNKPSKTSEEELIQILKR